MHLSSSPEACSGTVKGHRLAGLRSGPRRRTGWITRCVIALPILAAAFAASVLADSRGVFAKVGGPNDITPSCSFPSYRYWEYCWGTPYSGPYTQAWMQPIHWDSANGYHDNVHFQPAGQQNQDYMNFHLDWLGVLGSGGSAQYAFYTPCTSMNITNECGNWNQGVYGGMVFEVSTTSCLGDGYTCAQFVAGDMKDCLTNAQAGCGWNNVSFVNNAFPNLQNFILYKDPAGHPSNLINAFCQVLNANFKTCSQH